MVVEVEQEEEENGTREIGSTVSCSAQLGSAQPRIGSPCFSKPNRWSNFSVYRISSPLPLSLSRLRPARFRRSAEKGRVLRPSEKSPGDRPFIRESPYRLPDPS